MDQINRSVGKSVYNTMSLNHLILTECFQTVKYLKNIEFHEVCVL